MSDAALKNAQAKRDDLAAKINSAVQQIDEWRRDLRSVEQFIQAWYDFAGVNIPPASPIEEVDGAPDTKEKRTRTTVKNPSRDEVRRVALEILGAASAPVARKDLFDGLKARGVEISGKDPEMVLSTMMWRMKNEFVRLPKWGYWFKERPYHPAGYDPATDTELKQVMETKIGVIEGLPSESAPNYADSEGDDDDR